MLTRIFMAGILLAFSAIASAQTPFVPTSEFYFDTDDNATKQVEAVDGEGEQRLQRLLQETKKNPKAKDATAQLAHLAMIGGRPDLGKDLYKRVIDWLDGSDLIYRAVFWNYGWDLFRLGEKEAALAQWQKLQQFRGVTAEWMPPTFAMALWSLDRKDEAVKWYAAAVRTEPGQWRTATRYAELLPAWTASERATLAEVQKAWAANPPEWR